MGSGAFLVETVRQLGDHVVAAWRREGEAGALLRSDGPAHTAEDAVAQARRMVAQRCIYGVDKDPQAVTLAKLSLWLVTLAKHKPFSFLDHALRCGDSLVGLGLDIAQLTAFDWDAGKKGQQLDLIDREIREVLREAVDARERIVALARDDSPDAHREKERLLNDAQDAVSRLRLIGDLVLGAFFSSTKDKQRQVERVRRRDVVAAWLASGREAPSELVELAAHFRRRIPAFHWMIEFPEVFWVERADPINEGKRGGKAWIDAFVGNPPFAGKNNLLSMEGGESLLAWLKHAHTGAHGNADYSAHFFRRCDHLLGDHGTLGLIATNTIAQGDTRTTGLQAIVADGGVIYDAIRTLPWPGDAAVIVSVVHIARGSAALEVPCVLDGDKVAAINSRLRSGAERPDPVPLLTNADKSFQGSVVLGMGFVLTPEERDSLIHKSHKNGERIFPYIGGEEVNSHPTQDFNRYVINFGDMTLEQAARWPDLLSIVREKVKPERDQNNREVRKKYWWRFGETTPALYAALAPLSRCLVTARVTKHLCISLQPTDRVLHEKLFVFPVSSMAVFAALQSRAHAAWTWLLSSTMKTDLNYSASDCFATFPFPAESSSVGLDAIGAQLYATRAHYMARTWQGLTTTYNQLKDPDYVGDLSPASAVRSTSSDRPASPWATPAGLGDTIPAITADPGLHRPETRSAYIHYLRHLHERLDRAVLAAYGWSDIVVPPYCPPRPTDRAAHAAVSLFEDIVIDRLFALNAKRANEEEQKAAGTSAPLLSMTAAIKKTATGRPKHAGLIPQGQSGGDARPSPTSRKQRGGDTR